MLYLDKVEENIIFAKIITYSFCSILDSLNLFMSKFLLFLSIISEFFNAFFIAWCVLWFSAILLLSFDIHRCDDAYRIYPSFIAILLHNLEFLTLSFVAIPIL